MLKLVLVLISLIILAAATPRPTNIQLVGNVIPQCNITTGVCTLPDSPRGNFLILTMNGIVMSVGQDYTLSGNTVTPVSENISLFSDSLTVKNAFYVK